MIWLVLAAIFVVACLQLQLLALYLALRDVSRRRHSDAVAPPAKVVHFHGRRSDVG